VKEGHTGGGEEKKDGEGRIEVRKIKRKEGQ
jgi:hypothetical protein